ncbi:MAG: YitT family protein [Schwartzia sp.]|nr:YitT family protein [Schwartzia sp. (in: firmicutes)]MBR5162787.1 YitT family protein [Schwartzia sp. (in: firmicutes)]
METAGTVPLQRAAHPWKKTLRKYLVLFLGAFIASIGLEIFLVPNEIIDGGVVGLSIMAGAITRQEYGIFLVLFNLPFLYLGYKQIGKDFVIATTVAIIFLAIWTAYFTPVPQLTDDLFLASIFGGIIDGIGVGLIMRAGASLDGTEIVAIIADKKSVFSVGEVVMFINLFIFAAAGFLFDWERAMYSVVAYFVISKTIDTVLKGMDESYSVMIVTTAPDEIGQALMSELGRGITILYGAGGYKKEQRKVLYAVVTRLEVQRVKEIVLDYDETAFVTINQVHDIVGGRFKKTGH